jgi:HSP20 family protein
MKLMKWEPKGLASFHREMDRLLDAFLDRESPFSTDGDWLPSLDVEESPEEFVVTAELPGMDEKDISVTLSGNNLVIKGEKKREKEEKDKQFHRIERSYGSFSRLVPLPASTAPDKIVAEYSKGVLELHVPKEPDEMPKKIAVKGKKGK